MTPDKQTRRQFCRRTGVALTALGGAGLATTNASAQTTDGGGIFADGIAADVQPDYSAFVDGVVSRFTSTVGPPEDATTLATAARNEFNANSSAWVDYGNWLLAENDVEASGDSVVGVEFKVTWMRWPTSGSSRRTTIDVGYEDSTEQFTSLDWRNEPPEEPDFEMRLENKAAENAATELSTFRRKWIAESDGEDHAFPSDSYLSRVGGRYSNDVFLGSDSKSVLELFFGEVDI
jgi:hypothetical protein